MQRGWRNLPLSIFKKPRFQRGVSGALTINADTPRTKHQPSQSRRHPAAVICIFQFPLRNTRGAVDVRGAEGTHTQTLVAPRALLPACPLHARARVSLSVLRGTVFARGSNGENSVVMDNHYHAGGIVDVGTKRTQVWGSFAAYIGVLARACAHISM